MIKKKKLNRHYSERNKCINCGKIIDNIATRCRSCSKKYLYREQKNHPNYKSKIHVPTYCKDCKKKINYGSIRCAKCSNIFKAKDKTILQKISVALIGRKMPLQVRKKIGLANTVHGMSYLPYTKNFRLSKKTILKRDNYTCQYCGMTQKEHFKKYGRDIEVHHINYCTFNCKSSNLITLCKQCNINANYNRDYWYAYYTYINEKEI